MSDVSSKPEATVREFTIVNQRGLHARASARFVQVASGFDAAVSVEKDGMEVGDAIVAIDGRPVDTLDQVRRYLREDRQPALSLDLVHQKQLRHLRLLRSAGGDNGAQAAGGRG